MIILNADANAIEPCLAALSHPTNSGIKESATTNARKNGAPLDNFKINSLANVFVLFVNNVYQAKCGTFKLADVRSKFVLRV